MSIGVTFNSAHRIRLASEFFMARRPVLDREQNRAAHELLFCTIAAEGDACLTVIADDQPAQASVIADVNQYGMTRVIGDLQAILYVDAAALASDIFRFLPQDQVILELAPVRTATPAMLEHLARWNDAGFRFALAADEHSGDLDKLLPLVEGVRIDISGKDAGTLQRLCAPFLAQRKKLLAEKVDTPEQFQLCAGLGFDFFQGYHFIKPQIREGNKLSPSQAAIAELMTLVASDADTALIEHRIKGDVTLGLNLLRLVNTPAISTHRIDSLRQALMVLGRNQLQRWLQIMLYAEPGAKRPGMAALTAQATLRGRLMELIAQKLRPGNRSIADTAFTVGIMSLVDTLFSMPMEAILKELPVIEEVGDALLQRQGYYGQLLSLVECTEWQQKTDTRLLPLVRDMRLSPAELYLLQLAAVEWSDQVTRNVC